MSLVRTLGKVAIGAIAVRGIGKMMGGQSNSGNALGGLLGSLMGSSGGSASDMLSGLMGGGSSNPLSALMGGGNQQGGLGSMLAGMMGGQQQAQGGQLAGGLGGLLDSLGGGSSAGGGLGALLNQALAGAPAEEIQATPDQEKEAELMLRAMISAAKADGQIDAEEQRKLTEHLGDVSPEELELVRREMESDTNLEDLIQSVPRGMEQQIYLMSLLAIDLDSQAEAQYLDKLAKGLNITPEQANAIHEKLGVPALYG